MKATVLVPWVAPKFAPAIVTDVPVGPKFGVRLVMLGGGVTVKVTPLLWMPPTVTITLPVVAPVGTIILIKTGSYRPVAADGAPIEDAALTA